jgi:hypothetical protein
MIKAIVVAANFSQYATYLRNRGFNRTEYAYYRAGYPHECYGLDKEKTKVLWFEGWDENSLMATDDINFLKHRFSNHQTVSEVWIYGKGLGI